MADHAAIYDFDLEAVLARGWAEPGMFSDSEFQRAEQFYRMRRDDDAALLSVRSSASAMIEGWTGCSPRDVGSFGLGLNLESSDLDLGIGFPWERRESLVSTLSSHASFKGERVTRFPAAQQPDGGGATTTRLVFSFIVDGVEIDLSALTVEDFAVACRMLDDIEMSMSEDERIAHLWVKNVLRSAGRMEDYARWKLVTYARFCPEFNWVPIPEPTR